MAAKLLQQCSNPCCCTINASAVQLQPERTVPQQLTPARAPNTCNTTQPAMQPLIFGSTMQADTTFATDLLTHGHLMPKICRSVQVQF